MREHKYRYYITLHYITKPNNSLLIRYLTVVGRSESSTLLRTPTRKVEDCLADFFLYARRTRDVAERYQVRRGCCVWCRRLTRHQQPVRLRWTTNVMPVCLPVCLPARQGQRRHGAARPSRATPAKTDDTKIARLPFSRRPTARTQDTLYTQIGFFAHVTLTLTQ